MAEKWSVLRGIVLQRKAAPALRNALEGHRLYGAKDRLAAVPQIMLQHLEGLEVYAGAINVGGESKPTLVLLFETESAVHVRVAVTLDYEPEDGPLRNRTVRQIRALLHRLRPEPLFVQVVMELACKIQDSRSTEEARRRRALPESSQMAAVAGFLARKG